jgi:hypothetical protein
MKRLPGLQVRLLDDVFRLAAVSYYSRSRAVQIVHVRQRRRLELFDWRFTCEYHDPCPEIAFSGQARATN